MGFMLVNSKVGVNRHEGASGRVDTVDNAGSGRNTEEVCSLCILMRAVLTHTSQS